MPTIVDLREKVEDVRKRELDKAMGSLNGLSDDQKRAVEIMSQAIVNKLLQAPLVILKQAAAAPGSGDSTIAIARKLFNLDKELKKPAHGRTTEPQEEKAPATANGEIHALADEMAREEAEHVQWVTRAMEYVRSDGVDWDSLLAGGGGPGLALGGERRLRKGPPPSK